MFSFSNWISTKVFSWSIIYKKKTFPRSHLHVCWRRKFHEHYLQKLLLREKLFLEKSIYVMALCKLSLFGCVALFWRTCPPEKMAGAKKGGNNLLLYFSLVSIFPEMRLGFGLICSFIYSFGAFSFFLFSFRRTKFPPRCSFGTVRWRHRSCSQKKMAYYT